MFKRAERKKAKLRLALSGPSGSGKTTGALLIAKGIGGKIALLDTERKSASLYSDLVPFDVAELGPPYTPERYIEIIQGAEKDGYDVLILDSITHEWNGTGGILEIVDAVARTKYKGNSYAAWNEGTPRHQKFIDAMLASPMHIIATMRSKAVYVETEKANGKKAIEKQGAAPQQRDGLEYEFTAVLDLSVDGNFANASKDRTRLFRDPFVITESTGKRLRDWLELGDGQPAQAAPARAESPKPAPAHPAPAPSGSPPAHVTLSDAEWEFMQCSTPEALRHRAETLHIRTDNPDYARISVAYQERLAAVRKSAEANGANGNGNGASARLTDAQRKAIMAYYSKRGMGTDVMRDERLRDLSSFAGREIKSVNDLTSDEASAFIDAISSGKEAA